MDKITITQDVISGTVSTVLAALLLAGVAWLGGPFRWRIQGRAIQKLIAEKRMLKFIFNPETKAAKNITFLADGTIGEGKNHNENTWRIYRGNLEIYGSDSKIYSRFRYDRASGQLKHTNDPELRSISGQYIVKNFEKVMPK